MVLQNSAIKRLHPRNAFLLLLGSVLAVLVVLIVAGINLENVLEAGIRDLSWEIILLNALIAYLGFRLVRAAERIADAVE